MGALLQLRKLGLSRLENLENLRPVEKLVFLTDLSLDSTNPDLIVLNSLKRLRTLKIENMNISSAHLEFISQCVSLVQLDLNHSIISHLDFLPKLKLISSFDSRGVQVLSDCWNSISSLNHITDLDLIASNIGDISPLLNLQKLRSLHVGNNCNLC